MFYQVLRLVAKTVFQVNILTFLHCINLAYEQFILLSPTLCSSAQYFYFQVFVNPIPHGGEGVGGRGRKVPAPILTFENFLDI